MDRALREFRIRGVKTNIPFLENVILDETFRTRPGDDDADRHHPELFKFKPRRDRATKLLDFLGDVIVNGNPHAKGYRPPEVLLPAPRRRRSTCKAGIRRRARAICCCELGPKKFAEWIAKQKRAAHHRHDVPRCASVADGDARAHYRHAGVADAVARRTPNFSVWRCGAARRSTPPCASCARSRGNACAHLRAKVPNICFQMLFRGSNAVGYTNYPDNVVAGFVKHAAESGMDIFRIFDSLNYLPNMTVAMEAVRRTPTRSARPRSATPATSSIRRATSTRSSTTCKLAKELEKMGAHILAIKDMAGLVPSVRGAGSS